jgi:hypothetical protein
MPANKLFTRVQLWSPNLYPINPLRTFPSCFEKMSFNIVTSISDYRRGFGLDDLIYWHLIDTFPYYRQLQRYRWSTHFTVHRYTCTRVFSHHYSFPSNGFITVSLSPEVFFAQYNSFLAISTQSPSSAISTTLPNYRQLTQMNSSPIGFSQLLTTNSSSWTLLYNHFSRTTQKKTASVVKEVCLPIRSLAMDINADHIDNSLSIVEACLPSRCLETGCITPFFYCCMRVLLSNGCLSGSTILAWGKYGTILYSTLSQSLPRSLLFSGIPNKKATLLILKSRGWFVEHIINSFILNSSVSCRRMDTFLVQYNRYSSQ